MKTMKKTTKRISLIVLIFALVFSAVAMQAFAADDLTLDNPYIGVTATNSTAQVTGGNAISCTVAPITNSGGCNGGTTYSAQSGYLDLQNNMVTEGDDATLSFAYEITEASGNVSIDGTTVTENGTFSKKLAYGEQINVILVSGSDVNANTSIMLTNIQLFVDKEVTTTFAPGEFGSYTISSTSNGTKTMGEEAISLTQQAAEAYTLSATPNAGYEFFGWHSDVKGYVSYSANLDLNAAETQTVHPVFIPVGQALYDVDGAKFYDLNEADAAASGTIVLLNNGTLPAGDYTISAGNTLLIPYNANNTIHKNGSYSGSSWSTPSVYRKLTMASGANITVEGAINVGGQHCASNAASGGTSTCGSPSGPLGFIAMQDGSHIEVNSGASLYAWGYITGSGSVTANSGASVYENMQVADFRGGSCTSSMTNDSNSKTYQVFPFSQYYVQNIEVPLTLHKGATEYACTSLTISSMSKSATVKFIGEGALFTINDGYVEKDYIESTDRLDLTVNGNVAMNTMEISISVLLTSIEIDSGDYVLPINNNLTINVKSGSTIEMTQDMALLPGSEVNVEAGANMSIPEGYELFVYDGDEWDHYQTYNKNTDTYTDVYGGTFVNQGRKYTPVAYAPGRAYNRTLADATKDAKVDLNGNLTIAGNAYTTAGGANIISSQGTGSITYEVEPVDIGHTYQSFQNDKDPNYVLIPIDPLRLHNGNSAYTETADATVGTNYKFYTSAECSRWATEEISGHEYTSVVTEPTCTEGGYTTNTCDCGYSYVDAQVDALGHDHQDVVTPPTCTEAGFTTPICTRCGNMLDPIDPVPATGHSYTNYVYNNDATCTADGTETAACDNGCGETDTRTDDESALSHDHQGIVTDPTCTEDGYTIPTCTRCGDELEAIDPVPATGHSYTNYVSNNDATCTEDGTETAACDNGCGETDTRTDDKSALGHDYSAAVTAPDCVNGGYTTYTCSRGDHTYVGDEVAALGHTAAEAVKENDVAPKCEAVGGYDMVVCCSVCGEELSREHTEVAATGHAYDAGTITTVPTCTEEGVKTFTCGNDATHTYTEAVAALGHTEAEAVKENDVAPKCEAVGGYDMVVYCSVCNEELSREHTEVAATGHAYDEGTITTAPTCTEEGVKTFTCANDATHTYTEAVDALGHTAAEAVKENDVAPKCEAVGGYDMVVYCSVCNEELSCEHTEVAATGHAYDEGTITTAPTCTEEGVKTFTCANDATHTYTEAVDALGHTAAEAVKENDVAPKCEAVGGYDMVVYCSVCGDKLSSTHTEVAATGHAYDEGTITTAPTCTEEGIKTFTCANDATHTYTEAVAALGHTEAEAVKENDVAPKCEAVGGYDMVVYCSVCDEKLSSTHTEVAALGHSYTKYISNNDATCTADGTKTAACDNGCDKSDTVTDAGTKLAHQYESVTVDATCTVDGSVTYTCACGDSYVEVIKAPGHDHKAVVTAPTCEDKGYTTYTCACGDSYVADEVAAAGHDYESVTVDATCTEPGHTTYTCSNCGSSYMEAIAIRGHAYKSKVTAPTCEDKGYTTYTCGACGDSYVADEVAALGHNYESETVEATCTEPGSITYTCSNCGDSYVEEIAALEHDYESVVTAPTYTDKGYTTYTCKVCGYSYIGDEVPVLGHEVTTETVDATCTEDGSITSTCSCGEVTVEVIPALGHDYKIESVAPTCTEAGSNAYTCQRCDDSYVETVAATGHNYMNGKCEGCGDVLKYTVKFVDANGTVLETDVVEHGKMPSYDGKTPSKADSASSTFTFSGWTPAITVATKDATYTAVYTEILKNGFYNENGGIYHYVDGKLSYAGLIKVDGEYYYVRTTSGALVTDRTYWITYTNDLLPEGNYEFDAQGRMQVDESIFLKNGFVSENGGIYHYVDGELSYAGLIQVDGAYYYVRTTSGALVTDCTYWITYTNDLLPAGNYEFDAEGKIIFDDAAPEKDGFVEENGAIYYYEDGVMVKSGLIKVDGYYYYIRTTSGEVVTGRTYWITYTNDLMDAGNYTFDSKGRMIDPPDGSYVQPDDEIVKDGFIKEDGALYYYEDGVMVKSGLIEVDGYYYYVRTTTGEVVTGRTYWITYTNDLMDAGNYTFDAQGRMILD